MTFPTYEDCMMPFLQGMVDGQIHRISDIMEVVANYFGLSPEQRHLLLPSGKQNKLANRVGWARTYLRKAGLIESPVRGQFKITDEGRKVLAEKPVKITESFLRRYSSFVAFIDKSKSVEIEGPGPTVETPDEAMDEAYDQIQKTVATELLEHVVKVKPSFFERLVLDLLLAMGYGGAFPGAGEQTGGTGDGGIDGVIKQDKLGLDVICIQAKRWTANVGRPQVQAFAGSMESHKAKKGVMITTSKFSKDAEEYVEKIERKIVLIDGEQLAELMQEHNVGVSVARTYLVKKIDSDYFLEDADS